MKFFLKSIFIILCFFQFNIIDAQLNYSFKQEPPEPVYSIYIPNAFTPNGDGKNEYFFPVILNYKSYKLAIFNREGLKLFEIENGKWDGKYKDDVVQENVYVWMIEVLDYNDTNHFYIGHVTVLR